MHKKLVTVGRKATILYASCYLLKYSLRVCVLVLHVRIKDVQACRNKKRHTEQSGSFVLCIRLYNDVTGWQACQSVHT